MGVGLAELLASAGRDVTVVTPLTVLAPSSNGPTRAHRPVGGWPAFGVGWIVDAELVQVNDGSIRLSRFGVESEIAADEVVVVTARRSRDELYRELLGARESLASEQVHAIYRVGDCAAPRLVAEAILDGHRLGRELDSPDPARPPPTGVSEPSGRGPGWRIT